ncbi:hypothetical protein B0H19DRAFT_1151833 [Mycena capillaripes]|nr:hypothetical protein B0H19DRAFT_1151833 [Mycena capillaripes]
MTRALEVQEICDHICDFVDDSRDQLGACSLISPFFTSAAQRHIFRQISITRPSTGGSDVARLSRRLRAVLRESPHLLRFIRCLTVSFEQTVLFPFGGAEVYACGDNHFVWTDG